jgi:general secretion pathway protein C
MKENKKIYTLALLALLTLSAYFLADTIDAVIGRSLNAAPRFTSPLEGERVALEPQRTLSDYSSVLERGLFGDGKEPSSAPAPVAATNYKLIGTIEGESFAGAVLEDTSGQAFYRIHQKLPDGGQIVKVLRDRVTMKQADGSTSEVVIEDDTKIVSMNSPKPAPGAPNVQKLSKNTWVVDQREVAASTNNISQLLTQARALPYLENGKTVGFRISEIVPGSLYEKIGLQNGDVIEKINSQDVDDPAKFFQMYQGLQEAQSITLDLMRNGQRQTLNYEIR